MHPWLRTCLLCLLCCSFRTEDHVRPLPAGGSERRTWTIRYSAHQLLE